MAREGVPAFTGLVLHDDRELGLNFWYPSGWQRLDLPEGRTGVVYTPERGDWSTHFSVETRELGIDVEDGDLADLEQGFVEGLQSLPECHIESRDQWVVGDLIGLEAKYTFREVDATRKCWVRLLHYRGRQFHVVAQGATPEEYDYWLPMLYEMMMTLRLG